MGTGNNASHRWQPHRKLSLREQLNFERNERLRLASALAIANKKIERYEKAFGFKEPITIDDIPEVRS